jgi:type IV secretory pathway VirB10-like protein
MRGPPAYLEDDPGSAATRLRLGWLWALLAVVVLGAAVIWGLMRYTSLGRPRGPTVTAASGEQKPAWMLNGGFDQYPAPKPAPAKAEEDAHAKALEEFKRLMAQELAAKQRDIDELKRRLQQPSKPASPPPQAPKEKKRAQPIYLVNEHKVESGPREYTLPVATYIPCTLENVLNSEIPGHFTVRTRRPVYDASGVVPLIPQGARVLAKAASGDLLFGNERIPTFALSLQRADGSALELGEAPIMDAAGTNGLTGHVDNHTWRLIWTSIFIGGLQGGQQVLQTQLGNDGAGPIATGIARQGSSATQMRLGRAQDTRPTITAFAGEQCQILTTKAMELPQAH